MLIYITASSKFTQMASYWFKSEGFKSEKLSDITTLESIIIQNHSLTMEIHVSGEDVHTNSLFELSTNFPLLRFIIDDLVVDRLELELNLYLHI